MNKSLPIALTMGEPAGIAGEITVKSWKHLSSRKDVSFFVIGDPDYYQKIDSHLPIKVIENIDEVSSVFSQALPVLPVSLQQDVNYGQLTAENEPAVIESIQKATQLALEGRVSSIVTNPIQKKGLYDIGFNFEGHTDYLASLCNIKTSVMMLMHDDFRVAPLTQHIPVRDISKNITQEKIIEYCQIIHQFLNDRFDLSDPCIAISALNPHAGLQGDFGLEEEEIIKPAVHSLQLQKYNVTGPISGDTLFSSDIRKRYDAILTMYHDQALIPIKAMDNWKGVNITLGLPIIRTSPDHGTAMNIAGQDKANAISLISAIETASNISKQKQSLKALAAA